MRTELKELNTKAWWDAAVGRLVYIVGAVLMAAGATLALGALGGWDCDVISFRLAVRVSLGGLLLLAVGVAVAVIGGDIEREAKAKMAEEKRFENKVKRYLMEQGAWYLKYWAGAPYTRSGVPDLLACVNGYFLAIELKAERGKPTDLQLHVIEEIRNAGGFAIVLYPSGFDEFKKFVAELNKEHYTREMEVVLK